MLKQFASDLFNDLIQNQHTEGIVLFCVGSVVMLGVQIFHHEEFKTGLKGSNKLFEAPEISLLLFFWYSPYIIMYGSFLQVEISQSIWYFMGANLAFAFIGRIGMERIIAMRFGSSSTSTETKTFEKKTTTDETIT